jgi:hypothetical protein
MQDYELYVSLIFNILNTSIYNQAGYPKATKYDYWTSGVNQGCKIGPVWCSSNRSFEFNEVKWKQGHPSGDNLCVSVQISEKAANETTLASEACSSEKRFICEVIFFQKENKLLQHFKCFFKVHKTGYRKKQLQRECQEMWNVTVTEISFVDSNSFDASKINMNVKVKIVIQICLIYN